MKEIRAATLNQLLKDLPVPAMIVAKDRTIVSVNRAWARLTGSSARDAVGKSCRRIFGCRIPAADCPLKRVLAGPVRVDIACVPMSPHGRKTTFVERVRAFCDPGSHAKLATIAFLGEK